MELCFAHRLLLTLARDAPIMEYKRQAKREEKFILFVLNNELT